VFLPYPLLDVDPEGDIPELDYAGRIFGNDQVEAAFRRWYDQLVAGYADDPSAPPQVAEEVFAVLHDAGILAHGKVHLPPDHRYYNQIAAADAAFFFDADLAHDSRKIECHLVNGDGYASNMAMLVRLRNHPSAARWRDDPLEYAKWVGRNLRGAYDHYHALFRALVDQIDGGNRVLSGLMNTMFSHAEAYPHFYGDLVRKIGRSSSIVPYEMVTNVGPTKNHYLLITSGRN
jgi:hypothetical protein